MPRPAKGPRLYLRKPRRATAVAQWVIRDGTIEIGTGCGASDRAGAEKRLATYLADKYRTPRSERPLSQVRIADVIAIYLQDVAPGQARPERAGERAERLLAFFGSLTLAEISGALCREYVSWREGKGRSNKGRGGGARRDLQDLQAAINHHHKEGLHRESVRVVLPPAGKARQRWLTRSEAARLLWVCWRTRETQEGAETRKHPLRHLCRFLLIGLYTGSRPGAILNASWFEGPGLSYVDLEQKVFHRHVAEKAETTKRQTSVRLPVRLSAHLARWKRSDEAARKHPVFVVTFSGSRVQSVKTALARACKLAALEDVTPYTLRHTAASWLVSKGVPTFQVADYLGTSEAMIVKHYGHLSPHYQKAVAEAIARK